MAFQIKISENFFYLSLLKIRIVKETIENFKYQIDFISLKNLISLNLLGKKQMANFFTQKEREPLIKSNLPQSNSEVAILLSPCTRPDFILEVAN